MTKCHQINICKMSCNTEYHEYQPLQSHCSSIAQWDSLCGTRYFHSSNFGR